MEGATLGPAGLSQGKKKTKLLWVFSGGGGEILPFFLSSLILSFLLSCSATTAGLRQDEDKVYPLPELPFAPNLPPLPSSLC